MSDGSRRALEPAARFVEPGERVLAVTVAGIIAVVEPVFEAVAAAPATTQESPQAHR